MGLVDALGLDLLKGLTILFLLAMEYQCGLLKSRTSRLPRGKFTFDRQPNKWTAVTSYAQAAHSTDWKVPSQCLSRVYEFRILSPKRPTADATRSGTSSSVAMAAATELSGADTRGSSTDSVVALLVDSAAAATAGG